MFSKFLNLITDVFRIFTPAPTTQEQQQASKEQANQSKSDEINRLKAAETSETILDNLMDSAVDTTANVDLTSIPNHEKSNHEKSNHEKSNHEKSNHEKSNHDTQQNKGKSLNQIKSVKGRDTLSADDLYHHTTTAPMAIPPEVSQKKTEKSVEIKPEVEVKTVSNREKMIQSIQEGRNLQTTGRVIKPDIKPDIKPEVKAVASLQPTAVVAEQTEQDEMAMIRRIQYQNQKSGSLRPISESFAKNNISKQASNHPSRDQVPDPLKEHMSFLNELDNHLWDVKKSSISKSTDPKSQSTSNASSQSSVFKKEAHLAVATKQKPMRVDATPYEKFWGTYSVSSQQDSFYFPSILRASKKIELDGWWDMMVHSDNWDELDDDLLADLSASDYSESEEDDSEDESIDEKQRLSQSRQLSVLEKNHTAELKHLLKTQSNHLNPWDQPRKRDYSLAPAPMATKQGKTLSAFAPVPLSAKTDVPIGTRLTTGPASIASVGKK
jgi:hypothetical protein